MKNHRASWVFLNAILMVSACGTNKDSSALKVHNGIVTAESAYPSVALIVVQSRDRIEPCVGTFVNDSQLITAAHCFDANSPVSIGVSSAADANGKRIWTRAVSHTIHPKYDRFASGLGPYDLAVVNTLANSARGVSLFQTRPLQPGQLITLAGYGSTTPTERVGTFRTGTNTISKMSGGIVAIQGTRGQLSVPGDGTSVSLNNQGDTGSPIFVEGRLAGVAVGGKVLSVSNEGELLESWFVNLVTCDARDFLAAKLKNSTAKICSFQERRDEQLFPH